MNINNKQIILNLFDNIWDDYLTIAPDAQLIYNLLTHFNDEKAIVNDHIALRTFDISKVNLQAMCDPFLNLGYQVCGHYQFHQRKLKACHLEHQQFADLPKIFISEIEVKALSKPSQEIIQSLVDQLSIKTMDHHFCHNGRPWKLNYSDYLLLAEESEYASWVAAHGYQANHFTVFVNQLAKKINLEAVNDLLIESGFKLNGQGGLIKGSEAVCLRQSSTQAKSVMINFIDGQYEIPGGFYEFAQRYKQPDGKLYQGFVTESADKIFDSTNRSN